MGDPTRCGLAKPGASSSGFLLHVLGRIGLTTGHAHVTRQCGPSMPSVDDEIMTLRLASDGFLDGSMQELVPSRCAQRSAQVRRILLTQAHVERACAGDAHA